MGQSGDLLTRSASYLEVLLQGAGVTVMITLGSFAMAVAIGLILAVARTWKIRPLNALIAIYVEIFRGLPTLTLLFICYFGLTYIGIKLNPLPAAIIGLGLSGGAYCTEIFRSGISALHHGQREAAAAIGMTPMRAMRFVILPQALRITLPPLGNYAIGLIKDTAVASAVAAPEILFRARNLSTETFDTALIYVLVAVLYLVMTFPLARWVDHLEKKRKAWQ